MLILEQVTACSSLFISQSIARFSCDIKNCTLHITSDTKGCSLQLGCTWFIKTRLKGNEIWHAWKAWLLFKHTCSYLLSSWTLLSILLNQNDESSQRKYSLCLLCFAIYFSICSLKRPPRKQERNTFKYKPFSKFSQRVLHNSVRSILESSKFINSEYCEVYKRLLVFCILESRCC